MKRRHYMSGQQARSIVHDNLPKDLDYYYMLKIYEFGNFRSFDIYINMRSFLSDLVR